MSFLIGLLTVVLVLNCLLLILLVLIQLPKKEAGAGLAFGGAATDALFGAGSGNVLTKVTKYAAIVFFLLAIVLATMRNSVYHRSASQFQRNLEEASQGAPATQARPAPSATPAAPVVEPPASNVVMQPLLTPSVVDTNTATEPKP